MQNAAKFPSLAAITQAAGGQIDGAGKTGEDRAEEEVAMMEQIEYVRRAVMLLPQSAHQQLKLSGAKT